VIYVYYPPVLLNYFIPRFQIVADSEMIRFHCRFDAWVVYVICTVFIQICTTMLISILLCTCSVL